MRRIGLLGCGAMGTRIARAVDAGEVPAELARVYDRSEAASGRLAASLRRRPQVAANAHLLSASGVDLVVEAASQGAVRDVALSVLQNGRDLMVMSAGALLDEAVFEVLEDACAQFGRSVWLPSGAIAGLDGIRAAAGRLDSVELTTTKRPAALAGAAYFAESGADPAAIAGRTVLFEGPAAEAVRLFPANVNVAALLSLAGVGARATKVRVVADPAAGRNSHEIRASGPLGDIEVTVRNVPDESNPGTSRLAAASAVEALRRVCGGGIRAGS